MKNLLIVIAILLILSGCYTKSQAVRKFCKASSYTHDSVVYTYKDSTIRKTVVHDSTIIHPGVEQVFDLDNICDSLGRLRNFAIKSKSGSSTVSITGSGGKLHVSAGCDSVVSRLRHELDSVSKMVGSNNVELHDVVKYVEAPEVKWWKRAPQALWWWLFVSTGYCVWALGGVMKPLFLKIYKP